MQEDLELISGDFITADLPSDQEWLYRYFNTALQKRVAVYYVTFRSTAGRVNVTRFSKLFSQHTGLRTNLVAVYYKKISALYDVLEKATKEKDFKTIMDVKMGKFKDF